VVAAEARRDPRHRGRLQEDQGRQRLGASELTRPSVGPSRTWWLAGPLCCENPRRSWKNRCRRPAASHLTLDVARPDTAGGWLMPGTPLGAAARQFQRLFGAGTSSGLPDDQLLARFVSGRDDAAFEALVQRHGPMVLSVCQGVLKDPNDSQDAFQATFRVLVRKAGRSAPAVRSGAGSTGWPWVGRPDSHGDSEACKPELCPTLVRRPGGTIPRLSPQPAMSPFVPPNSHLSSRFDLPKLSSILLSASLPRPKEACTSDRGSRFLRANQSLWFLVRRVLGFGPYPRGGAWSASRMSGSRLDRNQSW
jgi:hypothetical protein